MAYKEINPAMWTPEKVDDCIEGLLIKVTEDVGQNKSKLYAIKTTDGLKNVWGCVILDSKMDLIGIGSQIKITYKGLGEKKGGNNAPKIFKVEHDEEPEVEQPAN